MEKKKTITITRETREVFVIRRRSGQSARNLCTECGRDVEMLTVEEAAALTGLSARTIYRQVELGLVHYAETASGLLLVCVNSLFRQRQVLALPATAEATGAEFEMVDNHPGNGNQRGISRPLTENERS